MLLAIDAGNTNIKLGLYEGSELYVPVWRLVPEHLRAAEAYDVTKVRGLFVGSGIGAQEVEAIIIASVVPRSSHALRSISERYFHLKPVFVDHMTNTGLKILYDQPSELGADRIVAAVAAVEKYGAPCIVVDFGTATTFNAINSNREYLGGIIAPGIMTAAEALFSHAAKLPRVDFVRPLNVIGRSTVTAMQSGLFYGSASLVDGLIERMLLELEDSPKVIATGGMGELMGHASDRIDVVDENLTLDGLRIIYEMNKA
ncbi:MAG TPA: type III pantothenate kinase [Pyrinomonadaceae bacterium]|jgi:type III pantothenate kinase|nr:type III pantothenate kinase [Pyrinomonadaceae bacterium]